MNEILPASIVKLNSEAPPLLYDPSHQRPPLLSGQISDALRYQNTSKLSLSRKLLHCRRDGLLRRGLLHLEKAQFYC